MLTLRLALPPESVTINYAPSSTTFQVVLEDQDDGNKVVKSFTFNNKVGETHTYTDAEKALPSNYEWADENNKLGDSITLSDTTPALTVYYVKHMHKTTTGTKDINRTIDGTKPDGSTINYSDKVTFNYTTDTDLVNGKTTTKYDHDSQSFNAVPDTVAPASIDGYSRVLNGGTLDSQAVTPNSSDINVHVSYIANDQKILIKAYDVHDNGKTELAIPRGIMTSIIGKSKAVVDTTEVQSAINAIKQYLESNGYTMITKNPVIPTNFDADSKVDQIVELDFDHKTDVIDHGHIPDGSPIKASDLETTVKRTVTVHNTDGSTQTVNQDFTATRTANYDPVTKKVISYNPWSGSSSTFTISPQKGYKSRWTTRFGEGTPISAKSGDTDYQLVPAYDVDAQHITADTVPGQNVDVYYDAQDATRTIKYQDKDTGKIVGSFDSDPGKVGTQVTVDIKGNVPDGYELTPGIEIPTQVDVTTDDVPVVVSVQRKGTTYSYTDKNLPTGVTADDLQKTVKRQIIEHLTTAGQDQDKYINQTANFVRTVTVYPATKDLPQKVVFGEWTPKTDADAVFSEKAIDQVDGYISVEVGSDTVTGHPITVVPSQVVQKSNGEPIDADTFHVYYRKVSTVPEGNIPEGTTKKDGTKLTDADLGTDIIRDIYETAPGTSEPKLVKVQKVRLTRDALVNQYTHEVLGYSDWRINSEYNKNHAADGYADTLPDYTPTAYTGYTPSVAEVTPIIQIDNNTPHLIHVYISYNNQKRTQVINYVDSATGKTVRTQTITGVSNQDSSENLEVPAGYEQDTTKKAENVTFSEDGQSIIAHFQDKDLPTGTIYVKAGQDTYTKDNVPENLRDQVVKEVTRTITVNRPGEKTPQVIKQTVIFHRTIKFDKVTGQVIPETATAWVTDDNSANGTWAEYDAPTIAGYVPTTATVASQSVTADTADANITINYTDNTQNIKLKAVDDTNNASEITIPSGYTTEISGTSSTPVDQDKLQGAIDKIVKALEDEGYKFAGNNTIDTYDNDKTTDQWITIHFTHQTEEDSKGQLPEGVTPEDLEKTITRTVHVKGEPTKGDHDETQTVTATRKAIYDKVAKKIIGYTDWTGAIPVFNIDQYTGYTSKVDGNAAKEVSSVTIDNNTPATLENTVTYEAGDATQIINYVTEDGTKVGTTSISGHVGDALGSGVVDKINGNVPSGYELVSGQNFTNYESNKFSTVDNPISVYVKGENGARAQIIFKDIETSREIGSARDVTGPSGETKEFDLTAPNGYDFVDPTDAKKNITFSTDGKTVIIPVYVKHHTDTIGPNDNPDDATKKLITQSLTGNATRTITVHKIDGSTTTETQTVQMHRSAIIDRATDTVTYTAWEADDPANAAFKEYTPAKQADYTTLVDGAPKDTVASETPTKPGDETVNVTYKASQKSAEIRYVDSKTKQVVKTDAVTGAPGEKVTNFTTSVPDGYVLDDGQKVPSEVDIAAGDQATDPITVYVHQKIDTLTTDQAKTHGVLDSDLARTVARTVIINEPGKASQTYTQVAHFTRQAQLNEATGAITYTAWTSSDSHFDAISVPEVAGYKSTVAATDPSVGAIDVTAEDRDKFVVVNYTAGDQDLTIRLHDVTDSSKSVDIAVPSDVTSVFHGKSGAAIDSTDLRSAISKIKDELAKQGYQYVGEDMPVDYDTDDKVMQYLDMNFKRVSQTVGPHDTIPEGTKKDDGTDLSEKDLTQTVTRTIYTTDPEDNQTRFTQTVVVTRTATIDMNTKKVTGFSAWSSASFDQYTAPSYKNYTTNIDVDGSGNNVVGRAVTADEIASGQAKDVHITYTKNTQEATPTNIPDGAKKSDGSKLTKDDLEKSVTRTIHFVDENGNKVADDSVEKVTFTRTATLDKDGKVISYSDWTQSGSWDDVTSPEKAGFKATIATIPAVALTPETAKDVEITVTYKPERVIGHIKFVDDKTGALVSDKIVDAKAGQTGVATNAAVPEGYEIAADSEVKTVPASLDFGATDHDDVIIKVSQKVDDVDPDHIPDGVKKSDGTPLTKDDLEKTITRHIHFVYPTSYKGAKDDDFDQTVTIKRTAQYNEATKTVIFGDWQPATLEAYTPADREGLVTPSAVPSLTVDENSQDSSVTLTYTTKTASMNFKAYDDTEGKDITLPSTLQTSISHAGDQTVTQTEIDGVVEGIKSAVGDNYKFEKTETDENGNVVVHFTHKTSPVTPTDSDQATTKEITRIIHVTTPDGKTYNYKQTVTATRTLTRDLVTGKVTEGDWTTPSFDQYGAPQYDGYTSQVDSTNSTEVTAHQVTADEITAGKASDVNVTYQANDQSFKVHFIDAKTGQEVLSPVTYSGKTGENVTIDQSKWNLANYKLVPGQNIPASVKLSAEPSDLYVTVDHNTTQYDTKNPGKFNLSKTITRTIKVVDPVTGATSVVDAESVTFTRTATVDNVDGSVIYSDWTPTGDTTWADFIAPAKTGYTASPETINGKTVSAYDNDETDIITYTANNHDVIVKYVDSTGKEVGNKTISGKTGATIPVDAQSGLPDGYEIDPNKPAPATYTVGDGDGQTIEVHVITGTHTYHEGDSNVPSNIQLAKTVTRTINTISPDGTISTQKQSITFTRTATVNAASGKVTYSDWIASVSSASGKDVTVGPDGVKFSAVTPVEKTGYKTNIDGNLAEETITADSNDSVVNVTYTPEDQSVVVKAVDDDNHGSDITDLIKPAIAALSGKTDAAIDPAQITSAITAAKTALADKYDYVSFDPVTKFGESGQGQLVIHFKHKTETLDKDHTGAGTEDDFVKEVTRTIHLTDTTNATHDYVQHATVSRTATKDLVTGAVTYSDWSVAKFDEFDIPQVDGYKSYAGSTKGDQTTAATQVASADVTVSNNIPQNGTDVYVSYKGNENTNQSIEYVDIATGKTVKTDTVSGIVGQNTTYAGTLPKGYELANNSSIPTSVTITANNTPVKIYVRQITYTDANKPSDLTDALSETITRTIHFEGITHDDVVQSVSFTRTATYNQDTGKYDLSAWTPWVVDSQFGTYNVPQVAGYTSQVDGQDATSVDAVAVVQADDNDKTPQNGKTVEVTYTAQAASQKVIYIDAASGEEVSSFTAKGEGYVTDASVDFDDQIRTNKPENYDFVDESEFPGSHKLTAGENTPVRILVKTHKDTYHDGDKNIPTGVAALSREITRTINVYGKDGKTLNHIEVQTVKFTRTATVDAKSGAITYSDWTVSGDSYWNSFDASSYVDSGYTAQRDTHIASASVTSASHDVVIDIYEKANDHAATVTYIDQTDAKNPVTVMSYTVHGQTDQDVTVPNQVPHGYKLVDEDALPAIIHFTADGAKDVTVYLVHDTADDLNSPKIDDKTKKEIEANLTKTVTRTITVHEPGKDAKNLPAQTVSFHRTFSYDVLTGQVTYGDWTPDGSTTWVAITDKSLIPDVAGYTHNTVDEVRNITADTPDAHVDVVYTPEDAQPVTFKAVNDTKSGEEIAIPADVIKSITGKTDAVVPADKVSDVISGITTALTKQGYTYVSVEGIPTKYSASGSTVTLHFKQVPGTYSTGNIPDEFRQYVSDKDLNRDVTRTIIEHLPSGDKTLVQRVHLTRTVTVDTVAFRSATNDDAKTKAISFGAWTPADSSFDEYDFDQVAGYESQVDGKAQTKADTLAALSDGQPITDVTVNVDYVAQDASQPIVYVDVVTGKTVGNTSVGGKTGESVDINTPITQNIPTGYKLVDNQSFSTTTLGATNKPIKVLVTADTKPATEEQIKADHGVVEKTIKRTIHYVVEGSGVAAPEDVTQEVHFTRSATYNPTTGKVTYGEWTPKDGESNTWASVTTPTIAGYIPTVSGFDAVTVTDRDVDEDLTVTYKPEVRNYKVNYVDQNGNVIKTDTVTGKTGDTVQINSSTPFGWNLDDGQTIPTTATLDADDTKNVATVHVHQVTKTIKGSDDTHNDALNKTVTRTVIITDTRGEQTKQVQSVHFTRNQEINLATGETHYTDWTADGDDKFDAVTAPTVDGYTIVGQAPEVDGVKATDPDTTVNISYVANKQTDTFKAVDDDQNGEPISLPGSFTTTLKGDSDTPITQDQVDSVIKDINDYLTEKGYVSKAAPTITTDEQGNKTITLHFGHGTEDTSATDPAAKKTVTRTIQFIGAGKQSPVVQTITATRTATKDTVTGETKYGDWTGSFDKYNAPVLDGYTMTIDGQDSTDGVVPSVNVDKKAPQNVTVTVVYTGKQGQQTVHYIDADTGKEVQVDNPQVIRATVGSTQEVNFTAPKGYDLIPGQKTSEEITIPATDTGIDVFVKQHVDNYDSKNNPDNLELTKDVTRTIIVNKPNEAPQSIKQTVHFTRTASVNAATGATTYSAWTVDGTDSWDAYTADDVNGYTTYVDGKEGKDVASQTVTAYTGNQTVNITYTANAKSVQIVYVDKTGKQLGSQTINGHTGSTENVTPVLPSGYQVPKDGKQVPTTITFPGDGSDLTNITITVEPTQHTYNPGDKDLDKEVSAEVRDKMFKTVTRTVNIYVPNEKGQEVKTTIVQEVHFARPVTVYGDGTVQYAKTWTPQGETKFDAINVDNFRGYDASVDGTTPSEQVPEVDNIPAETPDSTIDVHYLPQDQKVRFKVVDITDNKEITDLNITNDLESPVITGKSGTEIPTDKVKAYVDQIKKLMEARGYEFDSAIYPSDFDKDKSVDQQVILNFRHAKKNFEGTDTIPDNVKKGDNTALTKSDLTRDVTRKIILHTPNGDVEFTQHVTAPRTATVDEVTHVATLGDWTTPDFASQDVPSYRGYTAKIGDTTVTSVSSAPVAYVNDEPQNASDVVVDYVGQTGATQIDFVDKDGKIVGSSKSFEGQVGHDVTISGVTVPDGWKLAEGSTIPSSATVYADGRHVKVLVVHDTENVPSTKIPDGTTRSDGSKLTETDLKHDIVRKITLNKPAGTEVVIQHVVWSREAIVDKVTHQVVGYTDWTLNTQTPTESQDGKTTTQYGPTWKPIHTDAIKVAGYTPTTDQVTEVTPGPNANNDEITINYVAQPATVKVIYHDDKDNKDVAFDTIIGKKDGSKSTYDYQVPNGYQLAGDKTSAEFSFDGEDHYLVDGGQAIDAKTPFIIHLTHKTETFDKTSHAGFDDSDFERTVERHVRIHIPEHLEDPSVLGSFLQPGQTFEVVQSVTYERTATKDDATGKIIFSDWTIADTSGNVTENDDGSVDFKAVEAGQLAGYTPMTSAQEVAKVTADSRVSDLDIYYVENGTTITISARDNDTKSYLTIPDELQTTLTFPDVTGKDQGQKSLQSDVTAITAYFEKKGYDYVDVTQDGNHYTINFKHHIDHFTGDTCPDIPSDLDSAIKQPLTADVHREIEVHLPGQTDPVIITQTVHAHRTVSVDRAKLAKGDADAVKYDDWVFDDGDKFKAMPEAIQGYKTLINGVEAKDKNGTVPEASAKDKGGNPADGQKVVVTYQADVANAQIHYIDTDDGNKEIGTAQEVSGHSDEQKTVDTKLPDGYEYVDPSQKQVTIKFSDDGSVVSVNVLLKHKKVTTDKVPEGIKKQDGTDLTDADLTKTVTRTFDVLAPEGSKVDVPDKQTVTYKRSVTYDPVTKTVQSFGDWTAEGTDTWSQVDVPQVKGYTSVVDGTPSQVVAKVDKPQSDVTVKITYKAGQQQIRVIAVDDKTGAPIIIPVDGQALQTIIYGQTKAIVDKAQAQSYIEAIIYRLTKLGWIYDGHTEVPTLFDDDSSKDQNIVIGFHAEIDDYKPNDKLPDGAKDPNNKADQIVREMTKTRTIIFKDEKENVTKKVEQKVDFVRDVFINKVTNQVDHYGDWQYKDSNVKTWDAYDINKPGYTATVIDTTDIKNPKPLAKSEIDKQVVDDKSSDIELTVTYTKNPVKEDSGNNHGGNTSSGENGHKSGNTPEISNGKGVKTTLRGIKTPKRATLRSSNLVGKNARKLPQTGSDKEASAALGLAALGMSSALAYASKRKKRRN